ncbi:MAG: tetratricopeptide repeat protein, partial [Candidatus Omnitrophica bacterium]|nr:tetratricopeptide repeat protein [Candidatus Omnitrophota bacterium]
MKKIFLFIVLSVLCFSTCSTPLFAQEKSGSSVENIKPDKSAEQLDFANGLFQRELYEMAVDEYQKITKDVSVTAQVKEEALFGIAESYFFMNDYDRAASAYDTFLKNYAGTDRAFITDLRRGQIFFYKEKYKDSIQQLDAVNEERLPRLFL